jgi:hypothetical protein
MATGGRELTAASTMISKLESEQRETKEQLRSAQTTLGK